MALESLDRVHATFKWLPFRINHPLFELVDSGPVILSG